MDKVRSVRWIGSRLVDEITISDGFYAISHGTIVSVSSSGVRHKVCSVQGCKSFFDETSKTCSKGHGGAEGKSRAPSSDSSPALLLA